MSAFRFTPSWPCSANASRAATSSRARVSIALACRTDPLGSATKLD